MESSVRTQQLGAVLGLVLGFALSLTACTPERGGGRPGGDTTTADGGDNGGDLSPTDGGDTGGDATVNLCPRLFPPDGPRKVVISHPFDAASGSAGDFEVLALSLEGVLASTGRHFTLARATFGEIAFTPDGVIGIVAEESGTLGVFSFEADGSVRVVHAALDLGFYAGAVVMHPDGTRAFVLDNDTRANGGGIYIVDIACDGTLSARGRYAVAKLPTAMVLLDDAASRAALAAGDALTSPVGDDAHLLALGDAPILVGGADAFGDDNAWVTGAAATADGRYVLLGDTNEYSGVPTRVAVVEVGASGLTATQVLSPVQDPVAIVASPFGSPALVVSGYGNAIFVLDYTPSAAQPFSLRGQLTYTGARPALPGAAVLLRRGVLAGRVLVAENLGVRQVALGADGSVTDLGRTPLGSGAAAIVGALGVQP